MLLLKAQRKGIQPPDFHNHDGPHRWCPAHCRWCFGTRQPSPSCGATGGKTKLTPNHSVPEAAPARCVMTREGRKLYHVRNPFTPFEAMPTNISQRRHFLERNDGCPAPEDCSLCLKGHKDLVLPDLHKLATCLG